MFESDDAALDYLFEQSVAQPDPMAEVSQLYDAFCAAENELEADQKKLEESQKRYSILVDQLSELLLANNVSALSMTDGREIGVKTTFYGSASQERMPKIQEWLKEQGMEGIAKPKKLSIGFEDLPTLPDPLVGKVQYEIHPQTLKAFINDLARDGKLDKETMELFAVYPKTTVTIK